MNFGEVLNLSLIVPR